MGALIRAGDSQVEPNRGVTVCFSTKKHVVVNELISMQVAVAYG